MKSNQTSVIFKDQRQSAYAASDSDRKRPTHTPSFPPFTSTSPRMAGWQEDKEFNLRNNVHTCDVVTIVLVHVVQTERYIVVMGKN